MTHPRLSAQEMPEQTRGQSACLAASASKSGGRGRRRTWHGVLGEVGQSVGEGDGAAPAGTGHAAGDWRGGHLPVDGGVVGEAARSVAHGHPPLLRQGRGGAPLSESRRIRRGGGGGAAQAGVVGGGHREGGRGRSLVARGAALP